MTTGTSTSFLIFTTRYGQQTFFVNMDLFVNLSILSIRMLKNIFKNCQFVNSSIPNILGGIFLSICQFVNSKYSGQNIPVNSSIPNILARLFLSICQFFNIKYSGQNIPFYLSICQFFNSKYSGQIMLVNLSSCQFFNSKYSGRNIFVNLSICQFFNSKYSDQNILFCQFKCSCCQICYVDLFKADFRLIY